jgi:DNA polymerase-3 subunit beta
VFDGGMLSIGELARASGLPVSALRFYDGAGLLVPAWVDPRSGYRRYGPEQVAPARLLARLRRVGMPLADMRALLAARHDRALVGALVAEHLARLEAGLADARSELEYVMAETDPTVTTFRVAAADLRRALDAVRFALPAGAGGHAPADLDAVLFDVDGALLTLVATDRHRMAVSAVPVTDRSGPSGRLSVPRADLGRIAALTADPLDARIDGDTLHLADLTLTAHPGRYPAYRMVTGSVGGQPIPVDAAELRAMLADGPVHTGPDSPGEVAALGLDPAGALRVVDPATPGFVTAVNRGFLLDALDAAPTGQLVLDLDGPLHPLAIRHPTDPGTYSVLMPVRLP